MRKFKKAIVEEKNNTKIDSFLNGTVGLKGGSKKNPVHAKIKIPINAGYEPFLKPKTPTFVHDVSYFRCTQTFPNSVNISTRLL